MSEIPPLNALKAFWAASTRHSFSDAADDLHVTHGAVSRHIKSLEGQLGVDLFRRLPRGVELTDAGRELAVSVQRAFEEISQGIQRVSEARDAKVVSISTVPSIAARWLAPRLETFQRENPDVEIRISTTAQLVDLSGGNVDFGIRYGRGGWKDVESELLFSAALVLVCSPSLLEGSGGRMEVEDLANHRLIMTYGYEYWKAWLKELTETPIEPRSLFEIDDANTAIQAAIAGQGIGLLPEILVADDLNAGRLVRPLTGNVPSEFGYFIVYDADRRFKPHVRMAIDWVRREAREQGEDLCSTLLP